MRSRHSLLAASLGVSVLVLVLGNMVPGVPVPEAWADERPVSVGPYAQVSIGGKATIGSARPYAAEGPTLRLQAGTDLFQWLSVGGRLELASHEATVPAPPEGEYMQFYDAAGEARLSVNIGRIALYAEGSLGYSAVSTNILEKVGILEPGERFSPILGAGAGFEYQLQNRHYAFGLGGHWAMYTAFDRMQTVGALAHMRYTY